MHFEFEFTSFVLMLTGNEDQHCVLSNNLFQQKIEETRFDVDRRRFVCLSTLNACRTTNIDTRMSLSASFSRQLLSHRCRWICLTKKG